VRCRWHFGWGVASCVHLISVYLMGMYLTGVYLMGVYLINVHLIGRASHGHAPHWRTRHGRAPHRRVSHGHTLRGSPYSGAPQRCSFPVNMYEIYGNLIFENSFVVLEIFDFGNTRSSKTLSNHKHSAL
jgi:hypothetical protein